MKWKKTCQLKLCERPPMTPFNICRTLFPFISGHCRVTRNTGSVCSLLSRKRDACLVFDGWLDKLFTCPAFTRTLCLVWWLAKMWKEFSFLWKLLWFSIARGNDLRRVSYKTTSLGIQCASSLLQATTQDTTANKIIVVFLQPLKKQILASQFNLAP